MASGAVVGTISTTIWLPLRASKSLQRAVERRLIRLAQRRRSDRPRAPSERGTATIGQSNGAPAQQQCQQDRL